MRIRMNEHVIVALVATKGLEDFLRIRLTGLTGSEWIPRIVHVARPDNAADTLDPVISASRRIVPHSFAAFGGGSYPRDAAQYPTMERSPLSRSTGRRSAISAGCWTAIATSSMPILMSAGLPTPMVPGRHRTNFSARLPDRGAAAVSTGAVLGISVRKSSESTLELFDALLPTTTAGRLEALLVRTEDAGRDDHEGPGAARAFICCPKHYS